MVRVRKLVLAIAAATALTSQMALALGLGEVTLKSTLNQPLVAEIELLDTEGLSAAEIVPSLASAADFSRAGVSREEFLRDLRFSSQVRADGRRVILISSSRPIREPYLNFLLEVLWPDGRLLREYSLLLDPPVYSPETAAAVAPHLPVAVPPAQRPESTPAGAASASPQEEVYRTAPRDTLWEIAQRNRQGGSVHQAMLAIQDLNPNAFIEQNINLVKSGVVLRLPDAEQIASRPQAQAIREVAEQNARWRQGRAGAAGAARQLDATRRGTDELGPRTSGADNLRLVAPQAGGSTSGSDSGVAENARELRDRLAVTQESLDSTRLENAELKERLSELQGQVDKLQRLMQLKDSQLAELQAQLGIEQPLPSLDEDGEVTEQAEQAEGETPVVAAAPAQAPTQSAADQGEAALKRFLSSPAPWGGAALLLLLIALLVRSRRKAAREAERQEAARAGANETEPGFDESSENFAAAPVIGAYRSDNAPPVDPLTEATVCIAYGRYPAAAELLRTAIDEQPERTDLRLKLMEVYAELGDAAGFAREEVRLKEMGGSAIEIEQLKTIYPAMAAGAVFAATAASRDFDDLSLDDLTLDEPAEPGRHTTDPDDAFDLSLDDVRADASGEEPHVPFVAEERNDAAFDELSFEEPLGVSVDELQPAQEFSFDLDEEPGKAVSLDEWQRFAAEPQPEKAADPIASSQAEPFDFDVSEQAQADVADAAFAMPEEFDLSLDAEPSASEPATDSFAAHLDAAAAERELPAAPVVEPPAKGRSESVLPLADDEFEGGDDDFDFFTETDETTTKLDLARAYIDMGDAEGARDILDEVLREGSGEQRQEARDMLAKLA